MKPITNALWTQVSDNPLHCFAVDRSDFTDGFVSDPWNRPIITANCVAHFNEEDELTHWTYHTSFDGTLVKFVIFND